MYNFLIICMVHDAHNIYVNTLVNIMIHLVGKGVKVLSPCAIPSPKRHFDIIVKRPMGGFDSEKL